MSGRRSVGGLPLSHSGSTAAGADGPLGHVPLDSATGATSGRGSIHSHSHSRGRRSIGEGRMERSRSGSRDSQGTGMSSRRPLSRGMPAGLAYSGSSSSAGSASHGHGHGHGHADGPASESLSLELSKNGFTGDFLSLDGEGGGTGASQGK